MLRDDVTDAQAITTTWRPDIDGLRAVAVTTVVLFHAFPTALPGGFVGVDVFFVISGFLITGIVLKDYAANRFSLLRFYERRARRLFPALSVVLTITMFATFLFAYSNTVLATAKHGVAGALSLANIAFWSEAGYFDSGAHLKPFLNLWSLGVEEQFYLVWPLLLGVLVRAPRALLLTVAAASAASLLAAEMRNEVARNDVFYLPFFRVWELGTGALLAIAVRRGWTSDRLFGEATCSGIAFAGLAAIVASAFLLDAKSPFPGIFAVPCVIGAACVIWAGTRRGGFNRNGAWMAVIANKPAVYLGAISYSLYLWHWPLLSVPVAAGLEPGPWLRSVLVGVAVVVSAMTLRWVETPARVSSHPRRAAVWSCVALGAAASFCVAMYALESRVTNSPERQQLRAALVWPSSNVGGESCPEAIRSLDPPLRYCRVSGTPPVAAVVWGDSHADHLHPGLVALDRDRSWMLLGHMSCPPVVGIEVLADQPHCGRRSEAALRWIEASQSIRTVVMGSYGHYLDDTDLAFAHRKGPIGPSRTRIDGSFSRQEKAHAFEVGLTASVDRLLAAGKNVVLVIDVPELPFNPSECFTQPRWQLAQPVCKIDRQDVAARQQELRSILDRIARTSPHVAIADPTSSLCGPETCGPGDIQAPTYRDSHHLSVHGSKIIARSILDAESGLHRSVRADSRPDQN